MMVLDTCNASVQRDVAGAQTKFETLTLDSYPGEDVTELATEALHLIHILSGLYALPINLGMKLLKKITNTSSEFFDRTMYMLLDEARTLEMKYRLLDPISMGKIQIIQSMDRMRCALLSKMSIESSLRIPTGWP